MYSLAQSDKACSLVRAGRSGRKPQFQVVARASSVEDPEFRAAVRSANMAVEQGDAVWAAMMPGVSCLLRWIPVPFSSIRKSKEVLPSLLDIQIPFPVEDCIHGVSRWREDTGSLRAQVFAARVQDVEQIGLKWLEKVGVDPQWIVHEGLTMASAAALNLELKPRQLMISAASDHVSAACLAGGDVQEFFSVRTSSMNPDALRAAVLQLIERFSTSSEAAFNVDNVLWFGTQECTAEIHAALQELCPHAGGVRIAPDPDVLPAMLLAAFVLGQKSENMNFRRGPCVHPATETQAAQALRARRRALTAAAGVWIVLSLGGLLGMGRAEASLREDLLRKAQSLAPGKRVFSGQETLIVTRALEESRQERSRLVMFARGGLQPAWDAIVREAHRANVQIRTLTMTADGIELLAAAEDERTAQEFLSSVESVTGKMILKRRDGADRYLFSAVGSGA